MLFEPLIIYVRSELEPVENTARVDWDSLQTMETHDDQDRNALLGENQMSDLLGFREEETHVDQGQMNEQGVGNELGVDNDGAAIPTSDVVPGEMVISYDKNNPSIEVGTLYPTIEEFKLAVRQFAINKEFD